MTTLCYVATVFLTIRGFTCFINDQKDTFSTFSYCCDVKTFDKCRLIPAYREISCHNYCILLNSKIDRSAVVLKEFDWFSCYNV